MAISNSDLDFAYLPDERDCCEECGIEKRHGLCHICNADELYEAERALYHGDDSLTEALKGTARDAAFLDMTPWGPGPALAKRQAD